MLSITRPSLPLCSLLSLVLAATSVSAIKVPESSPVRERTFRADALDVGNVYLAADSTDVRASSARGTLDRLGIPSGAAYFDLRSGRLATLLPAEPLVPGSGFGNTLRWSDFGEGAATDLRRTARQVVESYLAVREAELGVDVGELGPGKVTVFDDGDLIQIWAPRVVRGVPVRGSFVNAVINHGNLVLLGINRWGDVGTSSVPAVDRFAAEAVVGAHLGDVTSPSHWVKPELVYLPLSAGGWSEIAPGQGYDYRLAWVLRPRWSGDLGEWEALVDAHSGALIAFEDKTNYAVTGVGANREIAAGVYPISNDQLVPDGITQDYPMPFADGGGGLVTDAGGNLTCVDGSITTTLSGPYIAINDVCGAVDETTAGDLLDLEGVGLTSTDCASVPAGHSAGDTASARSAFYEINRVAAIGRGQLPDNTWVRAPLPVTVNIAANCNASGGPGGLSFFTSGGGCANTGEIAGIFDHEWGHGMDGSDATPGFQNPPEGIADIYASLFLDESCMGRNFGLGSLCHGYGDPCTSCDGVRDIDYRNRASGQPHDLAWIDANCSNGGGPCGGVVHCEGAVYAEAVYELHTSDLQAAYGFDDNTAREIATQLTFRGSGAVGSWYSCVNGTGNGDGCNADGGYLNYLAADDDDGNLGNGTPHMSAIFTSFDRQGIACGTPAVVDSGCAGTPTSSPTVGSTVFIDRGIVLDWDAVTDASSYRVYRTEGEFGCDFGKVLLGEVSGPPSGMASDYYFHDDGLRTGRSYSYVVVPMGPSPQCFGPASACRTAAPAGGAGLFVDGGGASYVINGGDGDGFVDNCETVDVTFEVKNSGSATLTTVAIVSITSPSHPWLDDLITFDPTVSASMAAGCAAVEKTFSFVGADLAFDDTIELVIEARAQELDGTHMNSAIGSLRIENAESDFAHFPSRLFDFETDFESFSVEQGTFTRRSDGGASGTTSYLASSEFLAGQCDQVQSPVLRLAADSTLSLFTNFNIEDDGGGSGVWYDRANVGIHDVASGERTLVSPSSGRGYNASGPNGPCALNGQAGWAGTAQTWAASAFDAAALGSAGLAGQEIQLDVQYGTDGGIELDGFWFDQVLVTNVDVQVPDAQIDCGLLTLFADGFEIGDTSAWQ